MSTLSHNLSMDVYFFPHVLRIFKEKMNWHCPLCLLVTPGAVPLDLAPGVSDPDQLDRLTSVIHLKIRQTVHLFIITVRLWLELC